MATGTVQIAFLGLKSWDTGLGFVKGMDFVRVCDSRRIKLQRKKIVVIRNSQTTSEIQLEPASEGSPLLVPRQRYCESLHKTVWWKTHTMMVGNVALGGDHPIKIQMMTTTDTKDVAATVMRISDKGADIFRITVQGKKEADACFDIKNTLVQKNYNIPLVADIHFAPSVALRVAECFDKIRVNPGNFADRWAQFETIEYTNEEYQKELEHIEEVESAFEFARICRKLDFHNFVFLMKASNPDGLGDTIRVSLTEPPEEEIDPCRRLVNLRMRAAELQKVVEPFEEKHRHYFDFQRRSGQLPVQKEGEEVDYRGVFHRDGSVLMSVSLDQLKALETLYRSLAAKLIIGMPYKDLATVDSILLRELPPVDDADAHLALKRLVDIMCKSCTLL